MTPLPDDLYQAAFDVAYFAIPVRGTPQMEAKLAVFRALADNSVQQVLSALQDLAHEFRRDVSGKHVPDRLNGTVLKALRLAEELDGLIDVERAA
jgi:hypothetical protein